MRLQSLVCSLIGVCVQKLAPEDLHHLVGKQEALIALISVDSCAGM